MSSQVSISAVKMPNIDISKRMARNSRAPAKATLAATAANAAKSREEADMDDRFPPREIPKITSKSFCVITGGEDGAVKQWILYKVSRSGRGGDDADGASAGKKRSMGEDVKLTQVFGNDEGMPYRGHTAGITSVSIAPPHSDERERMIVTTSKDMTCKIWKPNGMLVCTLPNHGSYGPPTLRSLSDPTGDKKESPFRHTDYVNMAQMSSVHQYDKKGGLMHGASYRKLDSILTCSDDGTAALWNARTGNLTCKLARESGEHASYGHTAAIPMALWSSDGRRIMTVSEDGNCIIWDVAHGEEAISRKKFDHGASIFSGAWSFGDEFVLTAALDPITTDPIGMQSLVRLWNVHTSQEMVRWNSPGVTGARAHGGAIMQAIWNQHSKVEFLTYAVDGSICLWDQRERNDRERLTHGTDSAPISGASFGKDCILTASHDGSALLWDTKMNRPRNHFTGHTGPVWQASLSGPLPHWVVTASDDRTARVWKLGKSGPTGRTTQSIILGEQRGSMHTDAVTCAVFMEDSNFDEG